VRFKVCSSWADDLDSIRLGDMKPEAKSRKVKRSFTLTLAAVAFIGETRLKRRVGSNSEALELLLREAMLEAKRQQIDAAYQNYYDTASDEDLAQQEEWAKLVGPAILAEMETGEAQP
jgi:hypothetical protein